MEYVKNCYQQGRIQKFQKGDGLSSVYCLDIACNTTKKHDIYLKQPYLG